MTEFFDVFLKNNLHDRIPFYLSPMLSGRAKT